ncbi:MAG: pilus assembly protein TadG-related protein [Planctomycetota bacterium]
MNITKWTNDNRKRKGIAIAWVVITLIMTLGIMAIMLEGGRIYLTSHHLQNSADAAALAGARYVAVYHDGITPSENARVIAANYALKNRVLGGQQIQVDLNESNDPAGEIVIGRFAPQNADEPPTFYAFTEAEIADPNILPNALKVVDVMGQGSVLLNSPLAMKLGKIFGGQPKDLSRYAVAKIQNSSGAAIIALSEDETGLLLRGTPDIKIDNGGSIHVNSTLDDGVDINGNALDPDVSVISEINVVGDYEISANIMDNFDTMYEGGETSVTHDADPVDDPYDNDDTFLEEPALTPISPSAPADGNALMINGGTHILEPGYYPDGLKITDGDVTFQSGIYSFGESAVNQGGLSVTGGVITATEVMLHIYRGKLDIRGTTQMTLTPPPEGDYYEDISIFQSRSNYEDAEINGGGGL